MQADAYDALLVDHAAGALPPAQALLVETHLRLKPVSRAAVAALDAAGGALLEAMAPAEIGPMAVTDAVPAEARAGSKFAEARARMDAALRDPGHKGWRWRAPGLRELRLPLPGASLIRMSGGAALAPHGHTGEELTLVLRGTFHDIAGVYAEGDIGFADEGFDHNPRVPPGDECICLVATTGHLKFHSVVARLTARLLA